MILLLILCVIIGGIVGWKLRHKDLSFLSPSVTILVCLLLFIMGIEMGSDKAALIQLKEMGWVSLAISLFAIIGSVGITWLFYLIVDRKKPKK